MRRLGITLCLAAFAVPALAQEAPWIEPWKRSDWKWFAPKAATPEETERRQAYYAAGQAWLDGDGSEHRAAIASEIARFLAADAKASRVESLARLKLTGAPFAAVEILARAARWDFVGEPGKTTAPFLIAADGTQTSAFVDLPEGYDPQTGRYPLLIAMHGSGEQPDARRDRFATVLHDRGWIVACPLSTPNQMKGWGSREVERNVTVSCLDTLLRRYAVDPDRVVCNGYSMGANGTWEVGMLHRDRFAALAAHSGGPRFRVFPYLGNLAGLPIRAIVGADEDPLLRQAVGDASRFLGTRLQGPVVHDVVAGVGHDEPIDWVVAMADWMADLRRDGYPRALVHHFVGGVNGRHHWVQALEVGPKALDATTGRIPVRAHPDPNRMRANYVTAGRKGVARIAARVEGQAVHVEARHVPRFALYLSDRLCDLDRKVTVKVNGKQRWSGIPKRSVRTMLEDVAQTGDTGRIYAVRLELRGR